MTRKPALIKASIQPGLRQFCAMDEAKPWINKIGRPSPSSMKWRFRPSEMKFDMTRSVPEIERKRHCHGHDAIEQMLQPQSTGSDSLANLVPVSKPFSMTAQTDPLAGLSSDPPTEPDYLGTLNDAQRQAVETLDGPVLVLAGAGTGKTRVLTTRIAHLLRTRRAWPGQILAVTFTNKAAREMQGRVGDLIGGVVEGMPWLGTFHAIAAKILRRHAEMVGLKPNFSI